MPLNEVAMEDAELVGEARAGKRTAYEQLVRRWAARVTAVCHARLGRADAAEDLAQETLMRGLRALPTLSDPAKFGPWLCGIAARACLDWLKAGSRTEVQLSSLPPENTQTLAGTDDSDGPSALQHREEIELLMAEVERLPSAYREVLMHYYYEDCTYQELADLLGVSAATVNVRLTKARQMLRERLGAGQSSGGG
ncbi:MAG TPA: RNA polymerase sigma factor [Tepidisphaeraceae bacterium]|nr:RNA polymerase sigma factor [Tepidisphaeraceae bacterium]